jgi:hypothetical protein
MIFSLLIIHNHDTGRTPSTRVLHTATLNYLTSRLPARIHRSPEAVKEAIMTDINVLVQEFWKTSSDGSGRELGAPFFAMLRLLRILKKCLDILKVCFDITFVFASAVRRLG